MTPGWCSVLKESIPVFRARFNQAARDEELGNPTSSDASAWLLGPDIRSLGSIHSDRWEGTAADLAEQGFIGGRRGFVGGIACRGNAGLQDCLDDNSFNESMSVENDGNER